MNDRITSINVLDSCRCPMCGETYSLGQGVCPRCKKTPATKSPAFPDITEVEWRNRDQGRTFNVSKVIDRRSTVITQTDIGALRSIGKTTLVAEGRQFSLNQVLDLAEKQIEATEYCNGEFPCEASTAAAYLEAELADVKLERDQLADRVKRLNKALREMEMELARHVEATKSYRARYKALADKR